MHIFRHFFLSNYWWQRSDIWSQASYRYPISWEAFLDPSDFYFLFADLVGFYTHWTYMHIFRHIFLSNYWCQRSDIWSQASYKYPISWEVFFDPSDSYFLFAKEQGYHRWALAHSSSCLNWIIKLYNHPLIARFDIFCELHLQLGFHSLTGNMWQGYQKNLYFDQWQYITKNLPSQCNLPAYNRTSAG